MKRLMLVALAVLFVLAATPVVDAYRLNLQGYRLDGGFNLSGPVSYYRNWYHSNFTIGDLRLWPAYNFMNANPSATDYIAFDIYSPNMQANLLDDAGEKQNIMTGFPYFAANGSSLVPSRIEISVSGGTPSVYIDGNLWGILKNKPTNPSY
jgi:ABC-type glycerol-3-phosphate transport system substrate-binding protein